MSNIIAGVIRGQIPYLDEHIAQKKAIYERYQEGLKDLPVKMNPWDKEKSLPNFWLSCLTINEEAMAQSVRGEQDYLYKQEKGKSSPHEIDPSKAMKELGWAPTTMFKDGIKLTIQWYKEHMDWMAECTSGEYMKYYEQMYGNRD